MAEVSICPDFWKFTISYKAIFVERGKSLNRNAEVRNRNAKTHDFGVNFQPHFSRKALLRTLLIGDSR